MIRARFEIEPAGCAHVLAVRASIGMEGGPEGVGGTAVGGTVVSEDAGQAVLEFPSANWGANVPLLVSTLVAGEGMETRAFSRCRLVGLDLPAGLLPGPAFGIDALGLAVAGRVAVGVIVKPSLGLGPHEVAEVARAAIAGGADFIKDDEILGDPDWCPLDERVAAVAKVLGPNTIYCPNITGPSTTLVDRARRVVALGATGVMINAFAQGLDSVLALRQADLGVPILAHRAGSAPYARNDRFGARGAVLARLTRLCGADFVIVGAFGGTLFETDAEVDENLAAVRGDCGPARPSVAVMGGGLGPDNVASQASRAGGRGLMMVLGSQAYRHPGGVEGGVAAAVAALALAGVALEPTLLMVARSPGLPVVPAIPDGEPIPPTVEWHDGHIRMIDQRRLPAELVMLDIGTLDQLCLAIRDLAIRGAPALGVAGALGIALAAATGVPLEEAAHRLIATRPTAVNLAWGVRHALRAADPLAEAQRLATEDVARNRSIGAHGAGLLPDGARVYTHCNAGALACAGYGTALGVVRAAHELGKRPSAWVGETRPVLQGARLTAWELGRLGIPATLVADVMAGALMAAGQVDCVVVGADRVAANGDVANKIGTYGLAVLAHYHGVPFYVAAPTSTIDQACPTGADIPIEQRGGDEVAVVGGRPIAPLGMTVDNRAFDVTPAHLITALITEEGITHLPSTG